MYKQQIGLRSVTAISFLSSGNSNVYTSNPSIIINGDPLIWEDTKELRLNQSLLYAISTNLDIILTFGGSYRSYDYINYNTFEPETMDKTAFDSAWFGFNYRTNSIGELVPMLTFQTALYQKENAMLESKGFNFKSYTIKGTLKGYSDPVVYGFYTGFGYNRARNFSFAKIDYGDNIFFGGDLSIVLSPKITLDLGIEQRFQTPNKYNNKQTTNTRSIPAYSIGSTYSLNADTSLSFWASFGGSSVAPDSIFGLNLWKKF